MKMQEGRKFSESYGKLLGVFEFVDAEVSEVSTKTQKTQTKKPAGQKAKKPAILVALFGVCI